MKKKLFVLAILFAGICSCKTNTKNISETLPVPTGTLVGYVVLYDEFGNKLQNYEGVTVSLDSTSYKAVTDSNGMYVLKNLPSNAFYNITFSKNGFGTYYYPDYKFIQQSGNAPVVFTYPTSEEPIIFIPLYGISSTVAKSLTAVASTGSISFTSAISNGNTAYNSATENIGGFVFISTSPTVSCTNYEHTTGLNNTSGTGVASSNYYSQDYYPSGTRLYFVAYGYSGNYSLWLYTSPINNINVYPDINSTPSNIISVVTQ